MATSRDREERGRVQQPSNRRNRLPDLISVTMSDGSLVEINLTGANREEREDVARFLDAHTTVAMAPPAAHRESRERSPRLVSSSGPTLRVTSPDVQDRIGQLPSPPIASHGESASDERMPLERAGAASFAQVRPQRCDGAPMSKASAVAPRAGSLPMSTAAAESPSEQRRKKTSWQQSTGEEMVWRNVRRTVWCCGKSGCACVRQTECCPFCICCFDNQLHIHRCPFAARYFSVLVSSSGLWP